MAIEPMKFRIVPDPHAPGQWAFHDMERGQLVGGFITPKAARRAYDRERRNG